LEFGAWDLAFLKYSKLKVVQTGSLFVFKFYSE